MNANHKQRVGLALDSGSARGLIFIVQKKRLRRGAERWNGWGIRWHCSMKRTRQVPPEGGGENWSV